MNKLIAAGLSIAVALTSFGATKIATAGELDAVWLRPKTGAHIKSFSCGGGLGLKVIKSKKSKNIGRVLMCGAKDSGGNKYKGSLREGGKTYKGYAKLSGSTLRLSGCILKGWICKDETWTKLQ